MNVAIADQRASSGTSKADYAERYVPSGRARKRSPEEQADRIRSLVAGFGGFVAAFESGPAFTGPSLYFDQRAIELRRRHQSTSSLLADMRFLKYAYAVLSAWGCPMLMAARKPLNLVPCRWRMTLSRRARRPATLPTGTSSHRI